MSLTTAGSAPSVARCTRLLSRSARIAVKELKVCMLASQKEINQIVVTVTGAADNNITWHVTAQVMKLSS